MLLAPNFGRICTRRALGLPIRRITQRIYGNSRESRGLGRFAPSAAMEQAVSGWNPFVDSYDVPCADGSRKTVFKKADKAFPLWVNGYEGSLAAKLDGELIKSASVDADLKRKVEGLLYQLDELNRSMMASFRAAYVVFQADPCANADFLRTEIDIGKYLEPQIVKVENGVDLLPATYRFRQGFDPEQHADFDALEIVLQNASDDYDYILLDAQAGSDRYSRLAMRKDISDQVILVSEYDPLSAAGIERMKQVLGDDLDPTRTWVLFNKLLPEFAEKFAEFLSIARYLPPIPWNADVVRAFAKRRLALDLEQGNAFTLAIMRTVKALFGDALNSEITTWAEERVYALRAPLEEQYANAELELAAALEERPRVNRFFMFAGTVSSLTIVIAGALLLLNLIFDTGDSWQWVMYYALGLAPLMSRFVVPTMFPKDKKPYDSIEGLRSERRIEALQEKLRQLEAMRSADLETLIKKGGA